MKCIKRALVLLLALITVFASACTAEGGSDSGDVSSAAESGGIESTVADSGDAQSAATDSSDEQSEDTAPVGFNDGIYYGPHKLGNSMCGDIWSAPFYLGAESLIYCYDSLEEFFTEDSFYIKMKNLFKENCPTPIGKSEKDIPIADFAFFYSCEFSCAPADDYDHTAEVMTYDEAKAFDRPFYMLLETAPLTDGVIDGIMAEYGVGRERAVAIYRQTLIDTLSEYGFYADGFFDWYSFDTRRAYHTLFNVLYFSGQPPKDNALGVPRDFSLKNLLYEDSVYGECTHLIFSVYAKGDGIEALEAFLKSDENTLFKARALPESTYVIDYGKEAYIPKDEALPEHYVDRNFSEWSFLGGSILADPGGYSPPNPSDPDYILYPLDFYDFSEVLDHYEFE